MSYARCKHILRLFLYKPEKKIKENRYYAVNYCQGIGYFIKRVLDEKGVKNEFSIKKK